MMKLDLKFLHCMPVETGSVGKGLSTTMVKIEEDSGLIEVLTEEGPIMGDNTIRVHTEENN